ncbi:MAG: response regulator [Nitrospiraceae bacterium]|jgi:signal transduction histidine kinase/ActR/RegA family two-component response regulator/sensor domain CHASE-containing protein|nr:response regulator [Nitrospiraceae bacterium]
MRFKVLLATLVLASVLAVVLFSSVYQEVRTGLIAEVNERQMTHAKQASRAIERFIQGYHDRLEHFATHEEIIRLDARGREMMQEFRDQNPADVRAITRLGADGRIMHTVPLDPVAIGADVRHQQHVQELLSTHKPVVSDVFDAVQGYKAIAVYVPVFRNKVFDGGLAVLFSAEDIARYYLQDIRIGENGYAWLISQNGIELYCPVPGHIGKSVYETSGAFPSIISMAEKMMRGEAGQTVYQYDRIRGGTVDVIRKHAVYHPIHLGDTLWSVVVATPEDEILSNMVGFRDRLLAIVVLGGAVVLVVSIYIARLRTRQEQAGIIHRSEEALRESERKLRSILEHTTNVFFSHGADHVITYMSPQAEKILDCIPGTRFDWRTLLTDNPVNADGIAAKQRAFDTGKPQPPYELELKTFGDRIIWVEVNETPVVENGVTVALVGSFTDVTDRKHLDEERRKAQKLESLGVLAGGIAHDFNNLLMAILGNISLAKHFLQNNEQALEQMEKAEKASERARDLAQQLLTFSRGGLPVIRNISVGELLRDTVSFTLRGSRSRFALSVPEGLWPIAADTGQISQVISNIVINADQAMPSGGLIRVAAENVEMEKPDDVGSVQRYVRITITDQGSGISPDIRGKIFDPYFTTKSQGSGLGLATCHSIVRNHHGFIEVRSEPGAGAAFDVYLPAASAEPAPKHPDHAGLRYGSERVLILDDEQEVREVLAKMLAALGYRPDTCADGDAALRLFTEALDTKDPYDLVIMDLTVPGGKGGKETIGPVRALDPRVSAIVSSGYADDPIMADYGAYGFDGVIPKPFTVAALSEVLAAVLAQHRSE